MSKSLSQLNAVTTVADADIFHTVRGGIDYKITGANLKLAINGASSDIIYYTKLAITSAQLLTGYSVPLLLASAPGSGKAIKVMSADVKGIVTVYNVPYATNTKLDIYTDTSDALAIQTRCDILASTGNFWGNFAPKTGAVNESQYVDNKGLYIKVYNGNPINGDFDVTVYVSYKIITL